MLLGAFNPICAGAETIKIDGTEYLLLLGLEATDRLSNRFGNDKSLIGKKIVINFLVTLDAEPKEIPEEGIYFLGARPEMPFEPFFFFSDPKKSLARGMNQVMFNIKDKSLISELREKCLNAFTRLTLCEAIIAGEVMKDGPPKCGLMKITCFEVLPVRIEHLRILDQYSSKLYQEMLKAYGDYISFRKSLNNLEGLFSGKN
jgi:hypothetical protein